ncbi:SMI1/KNR4 family protein [Actinoplanes philippinensis]|uniref:SMI1/KNR4 family protein n=1 Tax=Actinoplanes philippinensis TaxID=35752 RepID=UPI003409D01E
MGSWIASDDDLTRVETELGVRLPEKYKQFMKVFGGGVFVHLELIPPASPNSRTGDLVDLNSGDNEVPGFVCVAPDGAGNHWGFVTVDGVCREQVSYYSFEDEEIEPEADDFLEFVSWRGLHAGREGH